MSACDDSTVVRIGVFAGASQFITTFGDRLENSTGASGRPEAGVLVRGPQRARDDTDGLRRETLLGHPNDTQASRSARIGQLDDFFGSGVEPVRLDMHMDDLSRVHVIDSIRNHGHGVLPVSQVR
ncbi:hypothetical protein D7V80_13345 [Corallococcus sp. CA054B]|nr:hypothetical protein D7V80_13345 [Corallococcus sp. CA054B]